MPASNAAVERLFSQLKLIKTDHRNSLKNETISALIHVKDYLRGLRTRKPDGSFHSFSYNSISFPDELVRLVLDKKAVRANKAINPGEKSKVIVQNPEINGKSAQ